MSNVAIIENGVIINIIVADLEWAYGAFPNADVMICPEGVGIGWLFVDGLWNPPLTVEVPLVLATRVSRRQGLLALFVEENIRDTDIQQVIDAIEDPKQRYCAQVEFNNQNWEIDNEYVQQFAAALDITPDRLQELFNIAVNL